jgi:hypothetical protein
MFTIFSCQMGVGLHRRHDTRMPQPFLYKFPVYWLTILQVGTDQSRSSPLLKLLKNMILTVPNSYQKKRCYRYSQR